MDLEYCRNKIHSLFEEKNIIEESIIQRINIHYIYLNYDNVKLHIIIIKC